MKEVVRRLWKCGFCGKHHFTQNGCKKHESMCYLNPVNHHKCFQCNHLEKFEDEIADQYDKKKKRIAFRCKLTGKKLYSHKAEMLNHDCIYDNEYEIMPYKCKFFNDEYISEINPVLLKSFWEKLGL